MKTQKISLLILMSALAGCFGGSSTYNSSLASFMDTAHQPVNGNNNQNQQGNNGQNQNQQENNNGGNTTPTPVGPTDVENLSDVVGSLDLAKANNIYHSDKYNNTAQLSNGITMTDNGGYFGGHGAGSLYIQNNKGNGNYEVEYYPKYLTFSQGENGIIATTQMDHYNYQGGSSSWDNKEFTSSSIKKDADGSIEIIMEDANHEKAIKVLLGANEVENFNSSYGSYADYGVWQYGTISNGEFVGDANGYVALYNSNNNHEFEGAMKISDGDYAQKSDITTPVEFTGKTNAIKKTTDGTVSNIAGDAKLTLDYKDTTNGYGKYPQAKVELDFKNWKKVEFDYEKKYDDSISNIKVNGELDSNARGNMKLDLIQTGIYQASVEEGNSPVTVNEYNKATGAYSIRDIEDDGGEYSNIVGGFATKAKDAPFTMTPDKYEY